MLRRERGKTSTAGTWLENCWVSICRMPNLNWLPTENQQSDTGNGGRRGKKKNEKKRIFCNKCWPAILLGGPQETRGWWTAWRRKLNRNLFVCVCVYYILCSSLAQTKYNLYRIIFKNSVSSLKCLTILKQALYYIQWGIVVCSWGNFLNCHSSKTASCAIIYHKKGTSGVEF